MNTRALPSLVIALALSASCAGPMRSTKAPLSTKQIVERSKPAIVRIEADFGEKRGGGVGTGFVISEDGAIATNLHVIRGASEIEVKLLDGTTLKAAEVVAVDAERDLAIIRVAHREKFPTLPLGDSDAVEAGDRVIAIGNPLGVLDYTVSDGLISSVRLLSRELTILQISAPISQGSSGGPLFNNYGEVIGVATAIFAEGQNLNFGVPSNYVRRMLTARKDAPMTMEAFAREFRGEGDDEIETSTPDGEDVKIQRRVPNHDVAILEGCSDDSIVEAFEAVGKAIESGAPLYNDGNHEACFRIYEGASMRLERESSCKGVREAIGQGLLRAGTLDSYTAKAWAMRDAFDGLLDVIVRKAKNEARRQK